MNLEFCVIDWCGWIQGDPGRQASGSADTSLLVSEKPDVSAVPPLLRRRLNLLGRAAASQTMRLLAYETDTPIVYCSRHGDIERTLSVLAELAGGEPVSPRNFSLSVHNAVPGLISIHSGITASITSVASSQESLIPGLLEALGMLLSHRRVLCLFADVPLPRIYGQSPDCTSRAYACGFLLGANGGRRLSLGITSGPSSESRDWSEPVALAFARFLDSDSQIMRIGHNGSQWLIAKP